MVMDGWKERGQNDHKRSNSNGEKGVKSMTQEYQTTSFFYLFPWISVDFVQLASKLWT
jgi:hypothetical protein